MLHEYKDIHTIPLRFQTVSLEEFLRLYETREAEIKSVKIIPPRLGNKDFGKILIEWRNPVYAPLSALDNSMFA